MSVVEREDGAQIWWELGGPDGAPAVALVMGLGYPAAMWWRQIPAITTRYRVILIDNRGAGHTGDVVGAPYSIETMAEDVIAVLEAADVKKVHLVGLSMGGMIAQELALSRPELVQSLVLMATHPGIRHATFDPEALGLVQARKSMSAREAAEAAIAFNYAETTSRALMEEDWELRLPLASSPEGYTAQMMGGISWSSLDRLSELEPPLLILHGADDRLVPAVNGQRIADAVPGSVHVELADANHILTTDKADEVNELLLSWFDKHA